MQRINFDKLEILDQMEYINNELKKGCTLREITKAINIARSTLRNRFKKQGYIYDKDVNAYKKMYDKSITKVNNDVSYKNNTIVRSIGNKDLQSINDFNNIKNDLIELINNKNDLLKMLKCYKNNTNVIDVPQLDINALPGELQMDIITKSIKVYSPIYELFYKLCKDYSSIKKQDLISLALYEFYNKYKK